MKEYVSVGKNVNIAIEDGLKFLGLNREDVDIKILETGGLFKKAKVCLIYEEKQPEIVEELKVIEEVKPEIKETLIDKEVIKEENIQTSIIEETIEEKSEDQEVKDNKIDKKPTSSNVGPEQLIDRVKQFLVEMASKLKIDTIEVNYIINENDINFTINGERVGKLIGYRGETLNAIQVLLGSLKRSGEGKYRLYLDIENYKKEREQTLINLANKMADKAEEIERNVHLDPMSAYERRIIHSALQNRTLVETESMGEGEKRHVVIKFKR